MQELKQEVKKKYALTTYDKKSLNKNHTNTKINVFSISNCSLSVLWEEII